MPSFVSFAGGSFGVGSPPSPPPTPPTPVVISTAVGSRFVSLPQCTIAFSDALTGQWFDQPNIYLDRLRMCAAPEIDQATATWFYGFQAAKINGEFRVLWLSCSAVRPS